MVLKVRENHPGLGNSSFALSTLVPWQAGRPVNLGLVALQSQPGGHLMEATWLAAGPGPAPGLASRGSLRNNFICKCTVGEQP